MQPYVSKPERMGPHPNPEQLFTIEGVNTVSMKNIAKWLKLGWEDLKANPSASLAYGGIFAAVGIVLALLISSNIGLVLTASLGFMLAGPLLALGLYDLSRRHEKGQQATFAHSLKAIGRNWAGLGWYAIAIVTVMIFWMSIAAVVTGIFFENGIQASNYSSFLTGLFSQENLGSFLLVYGGMGFLLAYCVYLTGVVTVPMLLDRKFDVATGIVTSIKAVWHNHLTMLVWAAVIVLVIGVAIIPFYLGLIVAMPLIAHASWHAYRDLVEVADKK